MAVSGLTASRLGNGADQTFQSRRAANDDRQSGIHIVRRALRAPARHIADGLGRTSVRAIFQSPVNLPVITGVQNRRQKSAAAGHQSRPLIRPEGMQSENTLVRSDDAVS